MIETKLLKLETFQEKIEYYIKEAKKDPVGKLSDMIISICLDLDSVFCGSAFVACNPQLILSPRLLYSSMESK
jgi:hypothetical protein